MELKRDFNQVLKSALSNIGSNIEEEKVLVRDELDKFNQSMATNYTFLDVAAILLKTANVSPSLGETSSSAEKKSRVSAPRATRASQNTTRYFMNIGLKDKIDEAGVVKLLTTNSTIEEGDITEIKLLDIFSFVEVSNGFEEDMMALNNIKFGRRALSVEKAGEKSNSSSRDRKPSSDRKPYANSNDRKPYGERSERKPFERSSKPYGESSERKPFERSERASSEGVRKPYANSNDRKPYGERSERKPYERSSKPYGESSERKSYSKKVEDGVPAYEGFSTEEKPTKKTSSYDKKPSGSSSYGKRPAGSSSYGAKSSKPYGDKAPRKPRASK